RFWHHSQFHSRSQQPDRTGRFRHSAHLLRSRQVESARLWRLSRPHRNVQTTLSAPAERTLQTNESAAARVRIRLPLELQGSESDRRDTKVTFVISSEVELQRRRQERRGQAFQIPLQTDR